MESQKYGRYICLFILFLSSILIYVSFTNNYTAFLHQFNIPSILSFTKIVNISENFTEINEIESNLTFESRLSTYHPRLPIHVFTQNISLLTNTTKVILIGNGFFGNRHWGIAVPGRSSTAISNKNLFSQ